MGALKSELFDEDSDQDDHKPDPSHLRVNEEYAKRFDHNKKRAELHRLQEKHPEVAARIQARGLDAVDEDESSTSEEEDEGQLSPETEHEWAQALLKIRKKDPSIYDASTSLFHEPSAAGSDEDAEGDQQQKPKSKKKSKKTLRDILYDQAVAETEGHADDGDTDMDRKRRLRSDKAEALAYDPEQRALRDALVSRLHKSEGDGDEEAAASGEEDDMGGLTVRQRAAPDNATDRAGDDSEAAAAANLDQYFATEASLGGGNTDFLRDYFRRRLWEEPGDDAGESTGAGRLPGLPAALDGDTGAEVAVDEDEDFLTRADQFEHRYNFRSEEPGGAEIRTYPRQIEGLARQEESRRKRQRESKRARQEESGKQRAAEVKQLKNLKKQEVGDALSQLSSVSGKGAPGKQLLKQLMDGDFDPDAWDQHMASAFGDDYYAEAEPEIDVIGAADVAMQEAQQWKEGDDADADGAVRAGDGSSSDEGDADKPKGQTFNALHKKLTGREAEPLPDNDYGEEGQAAGSEDGSGASESEDEEGEKIEKLAATRNKIQTLLQEYYQLDHEDEVGGVRTRFRYRQVEPINDGLTTEQILALPDADLNAIVGLRKLAPYHQDTHRIRPNYKALTEAREKLIAQGLIVQKGDGRGERRGKSGGKQKGDGANKYKLGSATAGAGPAEVRKGKVGVQKGGVEKKGGPKQKRNKEPAGGDGAAKAKRPGPRLRKALKEAAAAAATESGAPKNDDPGPSAEMPAVKTEAAASADELRAKSGKRKGAGPRQHRKALKEMNEEEKKAARLASYAPVAPSAGGGARQASGAPKHHKARPSGDAGPGKGGGGEDAGGGGEFGGMSKAAKKNLKRKLKRHSANGAGDAAA